MGTEQTTAATEEVSAARRAELASRLAAVRQRIADACAAAGRSPDEVALMAVTKTVSAGDVAALLDLGLDLRAGLYHQLVELGVGRVGADPRCTVEDRALYSHRRDGRTGRQAAITWLDTS